MFFVGSLNNSTISIIMSRHNEVGRRRGVIIELSRQSLVGTPSTQLIMLAKVQLYFDRNTLDGIDDDVNDWPTF